MSAYMVEVNGKFMVRLDSPNDMSALAAEHYFLDKWSCVWGANAFDVKAMKTETFIGCMLHDELITLSALERKLTAMDEQIAAVKKVEAAKADIDRQIEALMKERESIEAALSTEKKVYRKMDTDCNATRPM